MAHKTVFLLLSLEITHRARVMKKMETKIPSMLKFGANIGGNFIIRIEDKTVSQSREKIARMHTSGKSKHFCKSQKCNSLKVKCIRQVKRRKFYLQKLVLDVWGWIRDLLYYQFASKKQKKMSWTKNFFFCLKRPKFQLIIKKVEKILYWSLKAVCLSLLLMRRKDETNS